MQLVLLPSNLHTQGAPLNESDHCGDPPLLLAAGNGMQSHAMPCFIVSSPAVAEHPPCHSEICSATPVLS